MYLTATHPRACFATSRHNLQIRRCGKPCLVADSSRCKSAAEDVDVDVVDFAAPLVDMLRLETDDALSQCAFSGSSSIGARQVAYLLLFRAVSFSGFLMNFIFCNVLPVRKAQVRRVNGKGQSLGTSFSRGQFAAAVLRRHWHDFLAHCHASLRSGHVCWWTPRSAPSVNLCSAQKVVQVCRATVLPSTVTFALCSMGLVHVSCASLGHL